VGVVGEVVKTRMLGKRTTETPSERVRREEIPEG